jgi:hypothetical protein
MSKIADKSIPAPITKYIQQRRTIPSLGNMEVVVDYVS